MTIKLIIFDLDGTLVDSRDLHYNSLNMALKKVAPECEIGIDEHFSTYDGLPTTKKLELLTVKKGLKKELYDKIWKLKQQFTQEYILNEYTEDTRICNVLKSLKQQGYTLYIASNCVWKNLISISMKKGFLNHVDWCVSSDETVNPKPAPEIYLKCMIRANVAPSEVVIVEDSPIGKTAAIMSGAYLLSVTSPNDITELKISNFIKQMEEKKPDTTVLYSKKCNVVIPMAGHGSRFASVGYTFPKPLIDVNGQPMIEVVVKNLGIDPTISQFIFIVQKEHCEKYDLVNMLGRLAPNCKVISVDKVTEGAACTTLLAKEYIDNDVPLVIANSDQFVEWDSNAFFYQMENVDAGIATFESYHPKWSYAKVDENGFVSEVAEKKVISSHATVGIYYYSHGSDYVKYTEQMISKNVRVNNEFYVCPVFNEFILDNKKVKIHDIKRMWGLGVPEDLEFFLKNYK